MDRHGSSSHVASSTLQSVIASCALLGIVIAPAALLIAAICNRSFSRDSLLVAALAGIVCWVSGAAALVVGAIAARCGAPVQGVLLGMLFRMGLPLAAIVTFTRLEHALTVAGLAPTTLGVYLVALVAETLLTLRMVPATSPAKAT